MTRPQTARDSSAGASGGHRLPRGLAEADLPLLLGLPLFAGLGREELLQLLADCWAEPWQAGCSDYYRAPSGRGASQRCDPQ